MARRARVLAQRSVAGARWDRPGPRRAQSVLEGSQPHSRGTLFQPRPGLWTGSALCDRLSPASWLPGLESQRSGTVWLVSRRGVSPGRSECLLRSLGSSVPIHSAPECRSVPLQGWGPISCWLSAPRGHPHALPQALHLQSQQHRSLYATSLSSFRSFLLLGTSG